MFLLRQLFNWFKFLLALDFIVAPVILVITERAVFEKEFEYWGSLLAVVLLFWSIGILLLVWFFRIQKKHRSYLLKLYPGAVESLFYLRFPRFCALMEGGSFNGVGTTWMTYSNAQEDGSVYATRWIFLGFFPSFPLYQQRIKIRSENTGTHIPFFAAVTKLEFERFEKTPLDRTLIRATFAFYFLFFLPALILPLIIGLIYLPVLMWKFPGAQFWWLLLMYFAWGIFLFYVKEIFNKRIFLERKAITQR